MSRATSLSCIEKESGSNPEYSIIWLHGLGADCHDFEDMADVLHLPKPTRFIFPQAPSRPVTWCHGEVVPAWYDIADTSFKTKEDEEGIRRAEKWLVELIEREEERGIPSKNIFLTGFSQGGALSLHTGLRYPKPLGGILGLSAYLPLPTQLNAERHNQNQNIPIFLAHGTMDDIIPFSVAQSVKKFLNDLNYSISFHTYTMAHQVCQEEVGDIQNFIREKMSTFSPSFDRPS